MFLAYLLGYVPVTYLFFYFIFLFIIFSLRCFVFRFFFFFKQKTAYDMRISDWSSDVCSSDLEHGGMPMAAIPVRWEVSEDERFDKVVRAGEAVARPELGHSVHVEVGGLMPRRPYWYRFLMEGTEASPTGLVRNAPEIGRAHV